MSCGAVAHQLPSDRYNVEVIARNGKSARDTICGYVNHEDQDFDFLVVGCVGRKGPKAYVHTRVGCGAAVADCRVLAHSRHVPSSIAPCRDPTVLGTQTTSRRCGIVTVIVGARLNCCVCGVPGTTADHSLRGAHCSSIISRKPPPATGALYVVAVDGSSRAHAGVDFAASVARAGDTVMLLHVENDNKEGGCQCRVVPSTRRKT